MMKASELRIGNWYHSVKWNKPVQCTLEDFYELCAKSDGATNRPPVDEIFEPTPITEKWLFKFGLEEWIVNKVRLGWRIKTGLTIMLTGRWVTKKFSTSDELLENPFLRFDSAGVDIKYVHQLQNLYFALTGEELPQKVETIIAS